MCGKSFLLLKPDGIELEITDELILKLKLKNIDIVGKKDVFLDEIDILNLWPYTQSDIVSKQMFIDYLANAKCVLFYLRSCDNDIHKNVSEVKKYFREVYGRHQYLSVMHTPGSEEEYQKDMLVFEKRMQGLTPNKTVVGHFNCYRELQEQDILSMCDKIKLYMGNDYRRWIKKYLLDRYLLIAYKNGINDSYFLVGILRDNLGYSFELSYYLAFSLNYYKSFPIMFLKESEEEFIEIRRILTEYTYKTSIMKGKDYLYGQ